MNGLHFSGDARWAHGQCNPGGRASQTIHPAKYSFVCLYVSVMILLN